LIGSGPPSWHMPLLVYSGLAQSLLQITSTALTVDKAMSIARVSPRRCVEAIAGRKAKVRRAELVSVDEAMCGLVELIVLGIFLCVACECLRFAVNRLDGSACGRK
jgi:hypothetical protein